jgi:hypothetical protein
MLIIKPVFVGYWPTQGAVVVAHEGTDPTKLSVRVYRIYCWT